MQHPLLLALVFTSLLAGCSATAQLPADGVVVKGEVTWKGSRLKWGYFELADPTKQTNGTSTKIVDGQFTIAAERRLKPGNYKVMIFGGMRLEDDPENAGADTGDEQRKDVLPPEHNEKSKVMIEIKPAGNSNLRFDLK